MGFYNAQGTTDNGQNYKLGSGLSKSKKRRQDIAKRLEKNQMHFQKNHGDI